MRRDADLDDMLVAKAMEVTGQTDLSKLLADALQSLLQREAARTLIELGGTMPDLVVPPRRRSEPA